MAVRQPRKLFLNLPVRNLDRSVEFFKKLGFSFNPQFTDETAACMVLSDDAYVMLLTESRFKDFTRKQICDTSQAVEGLWALPCDSRAEVDEIGKDTAHERSTSTCRHTKGRVHPLVGWRAQGLGCQRAALRGLGDLSRQGIAGGSQPAVRVAEQRLVRATDSAVG